MFFPGCQLGASEPQYVTESYRWLLSHQPDTALFLNCCGAPAEWAGDEKLHSEVIEKMRGEWISLGKPSAVLACPTCNQMFERYLPEIERVFLYNLIQDWGVPPSKAGHGAVISVFDPCASRDEPALQQAVRQIVTQAGFVHEPLPLEGKLAACCSWGGQVSTTNPRYAHEVISVRITQNENPYVAYCVNCRDNFAAVEKPVYHLLDIIFGLHGSNRKPPTWTQRRDNRIALKNQALGEFWKDEIQMEKRPVHLIATPEVRQKISNEMILETDIEYVIEHCEASGRKMLDPNTGHFIGHLQVGNITYWAEYSPVENGFELFNAYSHRMSIEEK
jgi:hypothetical protein